MKKKLTLSMAILSMVLAVCILLYPIVSTAYNNAHQSEILVQHQESVEKVPDARIARMRRAAIAYNRMLHPISQTDYTSEMLEEAADNYVNQLDPVGDGIMGYVEIPKIQVHLPIYHGTADATLEIGVGHLLGSSLPVGGAGTHTVLTAHSGMASQKMFSDLPQLKQGDTFFLHVLGEILAYRVDAVHTVLPHDTTHLGIDREHDYCTLVTCTPFGVNTHRLLVRGTRIPYTPAAPEETLPASSSGEPAVSNWEQEYVKGILCGILPASVLLMLFLLCSQWRKRHGKT